MVPEAQEDAGAEETPAEGGEAAEKEEAPTGEQEAAGEEATEGTAEGEEAKGELLLLKHRRLRHMTTRHSAKNPIKILKFFQLI